MIPYNKFVEKIKKCPPGHRYDAKLKMCVPKISRYRFYGKVDPGDATPAPTGNGSTNGNGNGAANGNGNGNGSGGNGNGGNGGGNGGNGN